MLGFRLLIFLYYREDSKVEPSTERRKSMWKKTGEDLDVHKDNSPLLGK